MRNTIAFIVLMVLHAANVFSQTEAAKPNKHDIGLLIGNVVDAVTAKPIQFVTVTAMMNTDSAKKNVQVTDKNGAFEIDKLPLGYYKLIIKAIGYKSAIIDSIYLRTERADFNLGDIKITQSSTDLNEVIVYAEKPLIENKDGKITYNVGESALSNGSSTAEILKNMPLVSNDPNGKILLKGKEPKILIDDKPTDLTADQLKDLLESLPGSSIEKIELITNPEPQYATEQGGVINIITKKGKIGFTGKITVSAGTRGEESFSGNVSYRDKSFSTNNVLGISANNYSGYGYSNRTNYYTSGTNYNNTNNDWTNKNTRPSLRSQVDYEFNKQNALNITYQGNLNYFNNVTNTQYINQNSLQQTTKTSNRVNGSNGTGYNHNITLSHTWKGKNPGEVLRSSINFGIGKNDNGKDYFQQYLNAFNNPTGDSTQSQYFDSYNKTLNIRVGYDKPFSKKIFFSTGATYQLGSFHNTLNTSFFNKQDSVFETKDLLSNDFLFHQNIATIRASITINILQDLRLIVGTQAEETHTAFVYKKGNVADNSNDYWNMMHYLTVRKEFSKAFNMAIVYRGSINRPNLGQLNPNIDYSDNNNIRFGNPYLSPSTADNFDFNCSWMKGKYYINTSLGYNNVKNVFYQIRTLLDAGKTQATWQNIASRQEYEASAWGGYTFTKRFRINSSVGYSFNSYSEIEKKLFKYRDGSSFYTSLNFSYMPTNLITLDGNAKFSNFADPQGRSRSNLNLNFGVQKKFLEKRLIIGINVIDPISMQQYTTYTYGTNFSTKNYSSANTRNYRLTISYQLNRMVQKSRISEKDKQKAIDRLRNKM